MTFDLVEPDDAVYADYSANFSAYNAAQSGWSVETFSLVWRKGDHIAAGGRGLVYLGALELRGLWVDQADRGAGLGGRLLAAIEDEAWSRGARKAMLYTYSWQAEHFYKRNGYAAYARFDFPDGHSRIDMQKAL